MSEPSVREWALLAYLCGDNAEVAPHVARQVASFLDIRGTERLYVALQWDLPEGAERAALVNGDWQRERVGRVNTGDPETLTAFLRWAFDSCPSHHVILVLSGTGLLDPRALYGSPDTDCSHLFSICDDSTAGDALSITDLGAVLRHTLEWSGRESIDILALDMRELQCLEVAYEFEGCVDILIAPQTRVPDSGWDFPAVVQRCENALATCETAPGVAGARIARVIVGTVADSYRTAHDGHLSLSALNLRALKHVAPAFDTLSLALVHSVGEELVWEARAAVATRLKPQLGGPSGHGLEDAGIPADLLVETEYLYDFPEMLAELQSEFLRTAHDALLRLIVAYLARLDKTQLERSLLSIEETCFTSGQRLRFSQLEDVIRDPPGTRRRLRSFARGVRRQDHVRDALEDRLNDLFTHADSCFHGHHSWLDDWPAQAVACLDRPLGVVYKNAARQQQRLRHLSALSGRVLGLTQAPEAHGSAAAPLVLEHLTVPGGPALVRHGGISLFRPRDLDQLIASDYLHLRFNHQIHWTVLLAVVNLIGHHPRGLWRVMSAVLATADHATRTQLLDRIAGPGSVIESFRDQFVVLAPVKAYVLSLEPIPDATTARDKSRASLTTHAYRVRLELAERDAVITEVTSLVDADVLSDVVTELVTLLQSADAIGTDDVQRIEALGATLGEDILQELGTTLATQAERSQDCAHLQLQIPRELMQYPWELMHHKSGWLAEDFAVGRQVFSRTGRNTTSARRPRPLRALVIGNPVSDALPLDHAAGEAERITATFERLASETDGLIDFVRTRDAHISTELTRHELRHHLRSGDYDIVHFAGHASFVPHRPDLSAWLLSDGPFTALAVRNTLRWREIQPWLVFVNACEAAMDGQATMYQNDLFGMASAFLDQGVTAFIGPLWKIHDTVAAHCAQTFYEHLLRERQTVGEALRRAKVVAKQQYFTPSLALGAERPRVALASWAGLVLYGNSTATVGQRFGAPPPSVGRSDESTSDG